MFKREMHNFLMVTITTLLVTFLIYFFQLLSEFVKKINKYNGIIPDVLLIILIIVFAIVELLIVFIYERKDEFLDSLNLKRKLDKKRILISKIPIIFLTCLISFFIGLALGEEGPSVFLGSILGLVIGRLFNKNNEEFNLTVLGGSLGFSLAFLNPLAGIFKYYKSSNKLNKNEIIKEFIYLIYSFSISYLLLSLLKGNFKYTLYFDLSKFINGPVTLIFLILPFIMFIFSTIYKKIYRLLFLFLNKYKCLNYIFVSLIVLCISILIKIYIPYISGSGVDIISNFNNDLSLNTLLIFLIIRFIFVMLSFISKFKGGVVLPTLSFGFLIGKIIVVILNNYIIQIDDNDSLIIMIISSLLFYSFVFKEIFVGGSLIISFGNPLILFPPMIISFSIGYFLIKKLPIFSIQEFMNEKFSGMHML